MDAACLPDFLETLYSRYNDPSYLDPDPLMVVRECEDPAERETVGLLASSLAVGRASLIVRACRDLLDRLGHRPRAFAEAEGERGLRAALAGFRYRFFGPDQLAGLLHGAVRVSGRGRPLGEALAALRSPGDETLAPALGRLVAEMESAAGPLGALLPSPARGSACKRPFLWLRWMVRRDAVDPGGWDPALAPLLVCPMDTHMTWVAARLGFTRAGAPADLRTALAVTARFRELLPADPVRYDFALTRPGIRPELDREACFADL